MRYSLHFLVSCLLMLSYSSLIVAKKAPAPSPFTINLPDTEVTHNQQGQKVNAKTGLLLSASQLNYKVKPDTPENMARQYLRENRQQWGFMHANLQDLTHHATRKNLAGHTVRFKQVVDGVPVADATIVVHINRHNVVNLVNSSYKTGIQLSKKAPQVATQQAQQIARQHLQLAVAKKSKQEQTELKIHQHHTQTRLAYETIIMSDELMGQWHIWVDAHTGEIFKAVDKAYYYCKEHGATDQHHTCSHDQRIPHTTKKKTVAKAEGAALIFDPDPLSSAMVNYGGGFSDQNDADTEELNGQRIAATLLDIKFEDDLYQLDGPYASINDAENPHNGLFSQSSEAFVFTRSQDGFEAANTYYHIDASMRYLNETLGITVLPYQYEGGARFDPSGANGADNSYYSDFAGQLVFGEGCVDDAEDSDVIHHELGHALHDWITVGGISNFDGLSEGVGDYWAVSYNRGLGVWSSGDAQYNWVFNWDGHNPCWPGRITNYAGRYPNLTGSIHTDGQIWSTALLKIWDIIGKEATDKAMWEGLAMTGASSTQNDAANAVFQAAIDLDYTVADITTIHTQLTNAGYTLPDVNLEAPPIISMTASNKAICLDELNQVEFKDESSRKPTEWLWIFEGGTPNMSTEQNPTITYTTDGVFDVTLTATNEFGSTTQVFEDFIRVASGDNCPSDCSQAFTDSGGLNGNYADEEELVFTFCPPILDKTEFIEVHFNTFDLEPGFDFLTVYDGDQVGGCELGSFTGSDLRDETVTASSDNLTGCLTFLFSSDITVNATGWEAEVNCVLNSSSPMCGPDSLLTCGDLFVDQGGPSGPYLNNDDTYYLLCPNDPLSSIELVFTTFNVEDQASGGCFDELTILDGDNINAPVIGIFCDAPGGNPPPEVVTATNPTGCLSVIFTSDDSSTENGWEAMVNCVPKPNICEQSRDCNDQDPCTTDACDGEGNCVFTPITCPLQLEGKVWLEGAYDVATGQMSSILTQDMATFSLANPYSSAPWNYSGRWNELSIDLESDLFEQVVDWVFAELRSAKDQSLVASTVGLVLANGDLISPDGTFGLVFDVAAGDYWVVLRHRNHLDVVSSTPISLTPETIVLDFTQPDQVMLGSDQLVALDDVTYGLVAGDIDGNGVVTVNDFNQYVKQLEEDNIRIYETGDLDLDGRLLISDFNLFEKNATRIGVELVRY